MQQITIFGNVAGSSFTCHEFRAGVRFSNGASIFGGQTQTTTPKSLYP